jgi:hypothetical protein
MQLLKLVEAMKGRQLGNSIVPQRWLVSGVWSGMVRGVAFNFCYALLASLCLGQAQMCNQSIVVRRTSSKRSSVRL